MSTETTERVNHPSHYGGDTTYEAIKVIDAWGLNFCLGNAVKYICRAGKKDPEKTVEDLQKARWYLDHEIALQKPAPSSTRRTNLMVAHPQGLTWAHLDALVHAPSASGGVRGPLPPPAIPLSGDLEACGFVALFSEAADSNGTIAAFWMRTPMGDQYVSALFDRLALRPQEGPQS